MCDSPLEPVVPSLYDVACSTLGMHIYATDARAGVFALHLNGEVYVS